MKRILLGCALLATLTAFFTLTAPERGNAQGIKATIVFEDFDVDTVGSFTFCDTSDPPGLGAVCTTGTDANDGWMRVPPGVKEVNINVDNCRVLTSGVASCRVTVEGRYEIEGSTGVAKLFKTSTLIGPLDFFDVANDGVTVRIVEGVDELRVGLSIEGGTDEDGASADDLITVVLDFFS